MVPVYNVEDDFSMEDFAKLLDQSFRKVYNGDVLTGTILAKDEKGLVVDVGSSMDGILSVEELLYDGESLDDYKVGDTITASVKFVNSRDGEIVLSKKQADRDTVWEKLTSFLEEKKPVDVKVVREVKGGLRVVWQSVEGFMPASQASMEFTEDLAPFVGQTLTVQVIRVDEEKKDFVVSRKALEKEDAARARAELYASLKPGQSLTGKVVRLAPFGAFVELAPHVDGLVHVSDMSWRRVKDPSEILAVGDIVTVSVLTVDADRGRISLSLRDLEGDPWNNVPVKAGEIVPGTVTRVIPSGAFVEVAPGLEGFVHVSRMSDKRLATAEGFLKEGQEVNVRVLSISMEEKRMSLDLRGATEAIAEAKERAEFSAYKGSVEEATTNLGDILSGLKK